jgi:hypothetical protein
VWSEPIDEEIMLNIKTLQQLESWGFLLLPRSHKESLGNGGLLVVMHHTPQNAHFESETIHLMLKTPGQAISQTCLTARSEFTTVHEMGVGVIRLEDAGHNAVEFFTFGGLVSADQKEDETVYFFKSDAPIILLDSQQTTVDTQFAVEVQGILAHEKASQHLGNSELAAQLMASTPHALYAEMVARVLQKVEKNAGIRQTHTNLYHALQKEHTRLSG